jgi:hypothetical protein
MLNAIAAPLTPKYNHCTNRIATSLFCVASGAIIFCIVSFVGLIGFSISQTNIE